MLKNCSKGIPNAWYFIMCYVYFLRWLAEARYCVALNLYNSKKLGTLTISIADLLGKVGPPTNPTLPSPTGILSRPPLTYSEPLLE